MMNNIIKRLEEFQVVPVIAMKEPNQSKKLAQALCGGGLACAEVTFRHIGADDVIRKMKEACPEMLIGAGTVVTTMQVDQAIEAGAEFIVSPGFNSLIVQYCMEKNILIIPGCATPSDIEKAMSFGLQYVKFFPAEALGGTKLLKALMAPYSSMRFMPTGGISLDNIKEYLKLPNVFACGGSFMVTKEDLCNERYDDIKQMTYKTVTYLNELREPNKVVSEHKNNKEDKMKIMNKKRVVTFGELMLRLAPQGYLRFCQADCLQATFGGGEANVAVSLADFGIESTYVTKLPEHELGQAALNSLRHYGVDTSRIVRGGERLGIYYLEKGASQRPSKVIYDRMGSSIAKSALDDFDWNSIFENVGWFHFTGITPALSDELASICLKACQTAQEKGLIVSCDLNYRNKLWSREKACSVMSELCQYVDVCIANEEDATDVFGIKASNTELTAGKLDQESYLFVAKELIERFHFSYVAITLRKSISANDNNWAAMLFNGKDAFYSREYPVHIVDRVGGGDSFGAGLIYSFLQNDTEQNIIEFAVAASCLKHSIEGDYNMVSVAEVWKLANGDGSGRVLR